jgi:hypothetical protein
MVTLAQNIIMKHETAYENLVYAGKARMQNIKFYRERLKIEGYYGEIDRKDVKKHLENIRKEVAEFREKALKEFKKINVLTKLLEKSHVIVKAEKEVIKHDLEIDNNFTLADEILEYSEYTEMYSSRSYYNERIKNNFIGTYEIAIERVEDYEKFIQTLATDALNKNINIDFSISFDEWKKGYIEDGKRQIKIGKFLKKKGFSSYVLDFYSQQIKTEKTLYLTISDRVQHITGMSFYSNYKWDGMGNSSCQDTRHNHEENIKLLGSLHDNKLLIAFLHESLDDIEKMEYDHDCKIMLARVMCRIIHVNGKQFLISTNKYGNNETKDLLEKALRQLNQFNIYTTAQMREGTNYDWHKEDANGYAEIQKEDTAIIRIEDDYLISCECPVCNGSGVYEVETEYCGIYIDVDCPACGGSGTYETYVWIDIDEYKDVDVYEEVYPYNECYEHCGNYISIKINTDLIN